MQGVGLLALLLGVALIFYLMFAGGPGGKGSVGQALETKKTTEKQVNEIAGRDEQSKPVTDSITYDTNDKGIVVTSVVPGGAMEQKYGLKAGDIILEVGPLVAKELAGDAKGSLMLAYSRNDNLIVQRAGQRVTLPIPAAQGVYVPPPQRTTPRSQLEGVLNQKRDEVPTH